MGNVIYLRQHGVRAHNSEPIATMNITPLIDVMLVLLVMLIITLPMTLHKVTIDLPTAQKPSNREPMIQRLHLSNDGITRWNGKAMDDTALTVQLRAAAAAQDDLEFHTDANARYERFDQLIALTKRSGVTRIGFVDNRRFARFDK